MHAGPDIARREAVMQLLGTGLTPRQVGRRLGMSATAVYTLRRKITGGPIRAAEPRRQLGPASKRCWLHGSHTCLNGQSIRWHPL